MSKVIGNPTTTPMAIPDWNQKNPLKADYIKNKPNYDEILAEHEYLIGNLVELYTENTENLVGAVNEVYDMANNKADRTELDGKVDIVDAYGVVLIEPIPNEYGDWSWDRVLIQNKPFVGGVIYENSVTVYSIEGANNRFCPTPIKTIPTILIPNKQYNFGEVTELNLAFPTQANDGDVIYLTFKSGNTPTALTIDTTNTSDIEVIPEANTGYEIFGKYNGEIWIVKYSEYTVSEV